MRVLSRFPREKSANDDSVAAISAAIKCVILYQDANAGKAAKQLYDRLHRALRPYDGTTCELWSFEVLGIRDSRNAAASAAMAADIVIFAMSDDATLPEQVQEWIELWLWVNERGRPAVVVLSASGNGADHTAIEQIRVAAQRRGLSFFVCDAPTAGRGVESRESNPVATSSGRFTVPAFA